LEADDQLMSELAMRKVRARIFDENKALEGTVTQARDLAGGFPELAVIADDIAARATALFGVDGIQAKADHTALQTDQMSASGARFNEITANTLRRYNNSDLLSPASDWWPPTVEIYGKLSEVRLATSVRG
jgi:hypothetical protein